ncbi:MAG: tRNA pseudouridine(13) synthase TruD [Planctomycetes bacterium]|nr:tRNA pseudouridine(13) synthase TruD [Planctomycetota bacterium]
MPLTTIKNPLPQRFMTQDVPGIGGVIKVRPEDFLVEELPLYEPCDEGEHLYLRIQKNGVSHGEMMACLRRTFGVSDRQIGCAGMKDKQAVTQQTVSLHLHEDPASIDLGHERMTVLWAARHTNKLRTGHLKGNHFSIRIRQVDPLKAPLVMKQLRALQHSGLPNYFGSQRFGARTNNHLLGGLLLKGDYQGVLDELLGTKGSTYPDSQQARREKYDAGDYREAMSHGSGGLSGGWSGGDRSELDTLRALEEGKSARAACQRISRKMIQLYVNAFQSAAFNRVVDQRLDKGTLGKLVEGDLAWKHDGGSVFRVGAEELAGDELATRAAGLEISPSGPLWGKHMTLPGEETLRVEREALDAGGLDEQTMAASRHCPKGARRTLRETLGNPEIESGIDEHGPFIRIAFDLSRGTYATVLLREIMKEDA